MYAHVCVSFVGDIWPTQVLLCVSAGVRGAPQPRAEGLRGGLDHRHQPAGGNPHLPAVSCAALEGKHTNADFVFNKMSLR